LLTDILTPFKSKLDGHTELRLQRNSERQIGIVSGNITGNVASESTGISARVYKNGYWGFASSPELDGKAVDSVLSAASRNASFLTSRLGTKAAELKAYPGGRLNTAYSFRDAEQNRLMDFAKEIDAYIVKKYPKLLSRTVGAIADCIDKLLVTSDGSDVYACIPRAFVYVSLSVAADDGTVISYYDELGGGGGQWYELFTTPELLFAKVDEVYEELMKKREGVLPEAGVRDVIIDSDLAGILAHEAIGHTTEADLVMGGSVAGPNLGKQVASELITLVDFANTALGKACPQAIVVDDEGIIARDVTIIENGILKGFMHNRESAAHFGHEPTGNARAYAFSDEPLIRMRNTAILPGNDKLADMIASINDGYYLTKTGNGQADLTSEFMFGVNMGYEIKNGKIGRAIRDTTISGVAFDLLKTVTAISDEMNWGSGGMCGKKQRMPVGMGGPSIKCKVNIGGR
jgi:TldD protein